LERSIGGVIAIRLGRSSDYFITWELLRVFVFPLCLVLDGLQDQVAFGSQAVAITQSFGDKRGRSLF
jgi:hypothetical protein